MAFLKRLFQSIALFLEAPKAVVFPPETSLLGKGNFTPAGFVHGVEILNDDNTPMEFVVQVFEKHLAMERERAIAVMLDIHAKGGVLLSLSTAQDAIHLADKITTEARDNNHPLVCRVRAGSDYELINPNATDSA